MGLKEAFFNTWVASTAEAEEVSIAAAVNVMVQTNVSQAIVQSGVRINQDPDWHRKATNDHPNQAENQADGKGEQVVSVEAVNYEQTINMTGIFALPDFELDPTDLNKTKKSLSLPSFFGGQNDSKGGMGGSVYVNVRDNTTHAIIEDDVRVPPLPMAAST